MVSTRTSSRAILHLCSVLPVVIFLTCIELCDAAVSLDVYRLIQYDFMGVPYGSRSSGLNHHVGLAHSVPGADLASTVLLMQLRELNVTFIGDLVSRAKVVQGLIFLLPQLFASETKCQDKISEVHKQKIKPLLDELEQLLIHASIPFPVYFAFVDDPINTLLNDIKQRDNIEQLSTLTSGGYKLVCTLREPRESIHSPTMTVIQGWLPGLKPDDDSYPVPTITIAASYDTFGAAPALSVGSDSNGSGVVALLEISRLFSLLYSHLKTRGRYNLLFVLTSGGPYNYDGTHKWLRGLNPHIRESIEYAICLNSLGSWTDKLWLHVSKPPGNVNVQKIFHGLNNVAEDLSIEVGMKHKKINISSPRVAWEHEQFSKQHVTAATISEHAVAPGLFENTGGLSDKRCFINHTAVIRSTKLVAEAIARHVYGHQGKNVDIFADNSSLALNPLYIQSWLDTLSCIPRVVPFLSRNEPLLLALEKELKEHTDEVSTYHIPLDKNFTFYGSTKSEITVYQVASLSLELLLFLGIGSYLAVLFGVLVITTRGLDEFLNYFRPPPRNRRTKVT